MDFPTFFYRCPGPHWGPMWTTYDTRDVKNEADAAAAMADGWCVTVQEAAKAAIATPTVTAIMMRAERGANLLRYSNVRGSLRSTSKKTTIMSVSTMI